MLKCMADAADATQILSAIRNGDPQTGAELLAPHLLVSENHKDRKETNTS